MSIRFHLLVSELSFYLKGISGIIHFLILLCSATMHLIPLFCSIAVKYFMPMTYFFFTVILSGKSCLEAISHKW
jgi:hypothetical protein